MDIEDAIKKRKSIRKFKADPVPKEVLTKIIQVSQRAPSAENTQPWEFYVISGAVLDNIRKGNLEKLHNGIAPPEEMSYLHVVRPKGSIFRARQIEIAKQLFKLMDIPREDKAKRTQWLENGFRYFDAPAAIIIVADKTLPIQGTYLDVGSVMQNICLMALKYDLHTCIENQGITYADVVRKYAGIPDTKRLMCAIAIGYADWEFPANQVMSVREPVENVVTWCGF